MCPGKVEGAAVWCVVYVQSMVVYECVECVYVLECQILYGVLFFGGLWWEAYQKCVSLSVYHELPGRVHCV